jgi:methionyl-tRNA synthetase
MSRFYITTPIYYVNDHPHIGHIYTTLVADTIARYRRLCGDSVYFLTGTDEHGQNIERAAAQRGIEPIALADEVVSRYHQLWKQLGITHQDFIRTSEKRHQAGVQEVIRRIADSGDFYLSHHEGRYCSSCEAFYTEKELVTADGAANLCPTHRRETEWRSEENLFFRLSKYQDALLELYDRGLVAPESRANEVRQFVASGLRDLSVSRTNVDWAIPFPGYAGHTVYVWLDALTNYVSALGYGQDADGGADLYRRFWEQGDERVHLVGKDILRFHAVYWPAFLMSAGLPLPTKVWAHGWWLRDDQKISKSVGNIVRPDDLIEQFGTDGLRYFLLREMVFGQDASFSDEAFIDRYNSDLANDLGNTASRLVTLSRRAFDGRLPPSGGDGPLAASAAEAVAEYRDAMDRYAFHRALESLWKLLAAANQYLVAAEPWKRLQEPDAAGEIATVLWNALEAVRVVASGLVPILPEKSRQVLAAIGAPPAEDLGALEWGRLPTGAELPALEPIFPRIDKKKYLGDAARPAAPKAAAEDPEPRLSIDRFLEIELKVATVKAAQAVPKSNKLLQLSVDLGEGAPRTLVAGIAHSYAPEDLVGRQVVVVANLEPAELMGVESNGMVLAATAGGKPVLLRPQDPVPDGTRVR